MKYEQATGQITFTQPVTFSDLKRTPQIKRTRLILLILLAIELVITIAVGIYGLVLANSHNTVLNAEESQTVSVALRILLLAVIISLIYHITFIIMVIRYSLRGIRIFAWLTVILLIVYLVIKFIEFAVTPANSSSIKNTELGSSTMVIDILAIFTNIVLSGLTSFFAFKLVKLIKVPTTNAIV